MTYLLGMRFFRIMCFCFFFKLVGQATAFTFLAKECYSNRNATAAYLPEDPTKDRALRRIQEYWDNLSSLPFAAGVRLSF